MWFLFRKKNSRKESLSSHPSSWMRLTSSPPVLYPAILQSEGVVSLKSLSFSSCGNWIHFAWCHRQPFSSQQLQPPNCLGLFPPQHAWGRAVVTIAETQCDHKLPELWEISAHPGCDLTHSGCGIQAFVMQWLSPGFGGRVILQAERNESDWAVDWTLREQHNN